MKILLVYGDEKGTFGRYWQNALSKNNSVTSCGPGRKTSKSHIEAKGEIVDILEILEKMGAKKQPDLILQIDSPYHLYLINLDKVKAKTAFFITDVVIKLTVVKSYLKSFDTVFTCCESYVTIIKRLGIKRVTAIPFGIDPNIHKEIKAKRSLPVGFVGHINPVHNPKRTFYLEYLKSRVPITIRKNIYEKDQARFYSRCKIVFNLSATPGVNMRSLEALAAGALLMQNASCTDIKFHFKNNEHLVLYNSASEAEKKIGYFLKNDKERQKIAANGQKLVLGKYLYEKKTNRLLNEVKKAPKLKLKHNYEVKNLNKTLFMSNIATPKTLYNRIAPVVIRNIENFPFRWNFPLWYLAILALRIKPKFINLFR